VIEHNLEVIKTADWVIDLGPEAGLAGGDLVAEGTPEAIVKNPRSLTGRFLEPVLTAGPLGERPKLRLMGDPRAGSKANGRSNGKAVSPVATAEKTANGPKKAGGIDMANFAAGNGKKPAEPAISSEVKAPWELDGRQWHTRDRVAGNGRPKRWDGRILETIVERVEALGAALAKVDTRFVPADWSQRNIVRINGSEKAKLSFPFFHATTSSEWVVHMRFFVPKNTFRAQSLEKQLKLVPFHESPTPVLCDQSRLKFEDLGPFQQITIVGHAAADFDTPGFDAFLRKAVTAYLSIGKASQLKTASELETSD
jgi:excinuclease ABC subunit A